MKPQIRSAPGSRAACALIVIAGLTAALSAAANPAPPTAPTTTSGTYTVTPRGCNMNAGTMYCADQWLEERVEPGGSWRSVLGTFVNKPPGTYSYRSADTYCDAWFGWCYSRYSSAVTVTVLGGTAPKPEPLEAQLSYRYTVRAGNVVGNSRTDLLVERVSGPANGRGVVDTVVLQQTDAGVFQALVPTSAQRNTSLWRPSAVTVAVEDMNADGYADIALRNVASIASGASDQIVFASGDGFDPTPQGVRAFDGSLRKFTEEITRYVADNDYFLDRAPVILENLIYRYSYCPAAPGVADMSMTHMLLCSDVMLVSFRVIRDYSGFSPTAIETWRDELAVAAGDLAPGTAADRIVDRIEDLIGVTIGGWDLREIFGSGSGIDDPAEKRGLEGFLAIFGIANAHAQDADAGDDGVDGAREPDRIYIVARYLFGSSLNKMHTAVLYHMPVTGAPTWYSGFDSDKRALYDGYLVARTSDPADSPLLMRMTLGEVLPPNGESRFNYFFVNMLSAHDRYRGLPQSQLVRYDAVPEIPCGGCNGRNSNGYAHGLIAASNGRPQPAPGILLQGLTGWEYPVERHYFGR